MKCARCKHGRYLPRLVGAVLVRACACGHQQLMRTQPVGTKWNVPRKPPSVADAEYSPKKVRA